MRSPQVRNFEGGRPIPGLAALPRLTADTLIPVNSAAAGAPSTYTAFLNKTAPDHNLVGVADVVDGRNLTPRKLFTILMGQHLQLELLTVFAALGSKALNAVQSEMVHPRPDFFLRHGPLPRQQLRSAITS